MKKILPILLTFIILYTLPLTANCAPVGVIYEQGSIYDGGQIYFIYVNVKEEDIVKDSFYLTLYKGEYFTFLPLSQLKADLNAQWINHADAASISNNTLVYSKHAVYPSSIVIDESYSVSQTVMYSANNLFNIQNVEISSTAYLDNRTILSQSISNEDNHAQYDKATNTLLLNYTYDITEKTVFINQNGTTNEYLQKTYNSVQYHPVCILVEMNLNAVQPTATPNPTVSPTAAPEPTSAPSPTVTETPTYTPTPTTTPVTTIQPSPSQSEIPSSSPSPSSTVKPSQTPSPKLPQGEKTKYDDIWTYVILQSLIILIIVIILLSTRRRRH